MKQRSRAERLRGVRTLAVRHRSRIVALEGHPFLFARALLLSWSVRGNHPSKKSSVSQVRFRVFQSFYMQSSS